MSYSPQSHNHCRYSSMCWATLIGCLLVATPLEAAPPVPPDVQAVPITSSNTIWVTWTDVAGETSYEIYRGEAAGGPYVHVGTAAANATQYTDAGPLSTTKEYYYIVRSKDAAGESADSNEVHQNVKTVWSVPASHEILHNYNETIGTAGVLPNGTATGYHHGVDINRNAAANEDVHAARGGLVIDAGGGTDGYVFIRNWDGTGWRLYHWNHLEGVTVTAGDIVYGGQKVGEISDSHGGWTAAMQHTHFDIRPSGGNADMHPLSIYSAANDQDPGNTRPQKANINGNANDDVLYKGQGSAAGTYIDYDEATKPLGIDTAIGDDQANVDFHVELSDVMGTDPVQCPLIIQYWIVGPRPAVNGIDHDNVKSEPAAYMLWNATTTYFDAANWKHVVDDLEDYGTSVNNYNWTNYKHYIITNTQHEDGTPAHVDDAQYWNTNAKNDQTVSPTHQTANFSAKADTLKAHEARFPDGKYKVHVKMSDLLGGATADFDVRIENFAPIIIKVEVYQDSDIDTSTPAGGDHAGFERLIYEFEHKNPDPYNVNTTFLKDYQKGIVGSGKDGRKLWVRIVFSEQMDKDWSDFSFKLDPQGDGQGEGPISPTGNLTWSKSYNDNDTVVGIFEIAPKKHATMDSKGDIGASGGSADHTRDMDIVVKARDLRNRNNVHRGLDEDSDGTPETDHTDRNHKLKVDTKHDVKPTQKPTLKLTPVNP